MSKEFSSDIPNKPTRGLPLEIRAEYFRRIWGSDEVIDQLTDRQRDALMLYYGLKGITPKSTKEIQEYLKGKSHSIVRMLCAQGEEALDRRKREQILEEKLGVDLERHKKDMPESVRRDYIALMYGTLNLDYSGLERDDILLFTAYYGLGLSQTPTSMHRLRSAFGLKIQELKKRLKSIEADIAQNYRNAIAADLIKKWSEDAGRFCPRCGSTDVFSSGEDKQGNSKVKCNECGYLGGELEVSEKLVIRLANKAA